MVLSESQVVGIVIFSMAYNVMYSIVTNSIVIFITRGKWYCQKGKVVGIVIFSIVIYLYI